MIDRVLQFSDLQRMCSGSDDKLPRRATVERWARKQGIRYKYDARGGIWTTVDALNAALGVSAANDDGTLRADEVL